MKTYIFRALTVLITLVCGSVFAQQKAIEFTAGDQQWAVNSAATGTATKSGPFLNIVLDKFTMRVNKDYRFPQVKVLNYKIGLAEKLPKGQIGVVRWSAEVPVGVVMVPGQTRLIENTKLIIPIDGIRSLKENWLILSVDTEINGSVGSNNSQGALGLD